MFPRAGVFVLKDPDTLIPMQPTTFAAELDFQKLLSRFPALLVGDQVDREDPRRFLLVKQELAIGHEDDATRWSLDHLFLDQDGIPTLVEVKRQSDGRLRREVVGQMLDYAANFRASWTVDKLIASFEDTCRTLGVDSAAQLDAILRPGASPAGFWDGVRDKLRDGELRLLFVADHIPTELQRIVEFLNEHMPRCEVLAIELRQFVGEGLRTIVPMVFGQTVTTADRKDSTRAERWTEPRLLDAFDNRLASAEGVAARAIYAWMQTCGCPLTFGVGKEHGSVYPQLKPKGVTINPAFLSTEGGGKVCMQFKSLENKPVFGDLARRRELLDRFAAVENSGLTDAALTGWPSLSLSQIVADPKGVDKIIAAFAWEIEQVKAAG